MFPCTRPKTENGALVVVHSCQFANHHFYCYAIIIKFPPERMASAFASTAPHYHVVIKSSSPVEALSEEIIIIGLGFHFSTVLASAHPLMQRNLSPESPNSPTPCNPAAATLLQHAPANQRFLLSLIILIGDSSQLPCGTRGTLLIQAPMSVFPTFCNLKGDYLLTIALTCSADLVNPNILHHTIFTPPQILHASMSRASDLCPLWKNGLLTHYR